MSRQRFAISVCPPADRPSGRRRRRLLFAGVLRGFVLTGCLLAATPCFADEPPAALRERVQKLVRALDADQRTTRASAEQALLEAGPEILPFLPAAELLPNAATREAVQRLRRQLELQRAQADIQPATLTVEGTLAFADISRQIAEQTGNVLLFDELPAERRQQSINVHIHSQPFWTAVGMLAAQTELQLYPVEREGTFAWHVSDGAPHRGVLATDIAGAFRLVVRSAEFRPVVGDTERHLLRLNCLLQSEPRLRPLFMRYRADQIELVDEHGAALTPFNPQAQYELPLGQLGKQVAFHADYLLKRKSLPTRLQLTVHAALHVAAGATEIEFPGCFGSTGVARRRGGVTVKLLQAASSSNADGTTGARLRVAVSYDSGGRAFESHQLWMYHNEVWLTSRDGEAKQLPTRFETAQEADGVTVVDYHFPALPDDQAACRFVYVAPTLLLTVPLEFRCPEFPVPHSTEKGL